MLVPLAGVAIGGDWPISVCPLPFLGGQGHPASPQGLSLAAGAKQSSPLALWAPLREIWARAEERGQVTMASLSRHPSASQINCLLPAAL